MKTRINGMIAALIALTSVGASAPALSQQTTYNFSYLLLGINGQNETVVASITTDGSTGLFSAQRGGVVSQITAFDFNVSGPTATFAVSSAAGATSFDSNGIDCFPACPVFDATPNILTFSKLGDYTFTNGVNGIRLEGGTDLALLFTPTASNQLTGAGYGLSGGGFVAVTPGTKAPEIDPASAASGLTLLLGALAIITAGRRKPIH
jgi:hypothetical protein